MEYVGCPLSIFLVKCSSREGIAWINGFHAPLRGDVKSCPAPLTGGAAAGSAAGGKVDPGQAPGGG